MEQRSIRIPDSDLEELKEIAEKDPHFDDVSSVIRYAIRQFLQRQEGKDDF